MKVLIFLGLFFWLTGCTAKEELRIGAVTHFNRGNEHFQHLDYLAAVEEYNQAIVLSDEQPVFYYNLGLCYYHLVLFRQAESAFRQAILLDPSMAVAWYNLSLSLDKQNRSDEAFVAYDRYQTISRLRSRLKPSRPQVKPMEQMLNPNAKKGNLPNHERANRHGSSLRP